VLRAQRSSLGKHLGHKPRSARATFIITFPAKRRSSAITEAGLELAATRLNRIIRSSKAVSALIAEIERAKGAQERALQPLLLDMLANRQAKGRFGAYSQSMAAASYPGQDWLCGPRCTQTMQTGRPLLSLRRPPGMAVRCQKNTHEFLTQDSDRRGRSITILHQVLV
jgi:hypothetical protein